MFASGESLERPAAFLHPPTRQRSTLPGQLGGVLLEDGAVPVGDFGHTSVAGCSPPATRRGARPCRSLARSR